ncbi:helix-turn-helix domain-containing protein [Ekhidna sp.]
MEFSRELLFFFSALGAFNGLVIGLYFLFFAKPKHRSNYFLGILLLALSIRIGKSVFLYFNDYHLSGVYLQFGMSACLFIGPSIYFYLKSVVHPDKHLNWKFHYFPLLIIILTVDILFPWDSYPHLWRDFFNTIYFIWLVYLLASAFVIKRSLANLFRRSTKISAMEVWIVSIYLGNLLIWIAYNTVSYTSYIVGALSFSFIFYILILLLIFTRKKDPGFLNKHVKYGNKKIDDDEASKLHQQLNKLMKSERLFKDANLKMSDVAQKLNVLPHYLSQFINDNLEKNFTIFLNEYRIEEAKKLIQHSSHLKLESIGYECGFNSKSTFYTAFKKIAGTTPAKFKEELS